MFISCRKYIIDSNKNGSWDEGNYRKGIQPEKAFYIPDNLILRAYWDVEQSLDLINSHSKLWMQMQSGSQGISGKKTVNAMTMFDELFVVENNDPEVDEVIEDSDDAMQEALGE